MREDWGRGPSGGYLGRYTHRTAVSDVRQLEFDGDTVALSDTDEIDGTPLNSNVVRRENRRDPL